MERPRLLICPLDWGLGHAVRCVPVIRALKRAGAVPVIAADKGPWDLLKKEFPDEEFIRFPGVTVTYPSAGGSMFLGMLRQSPQLLAGIQKEKAFVEKAVAELNIQGVVSDNRFGAFSRRVPSVYISHQIHIQTGNRFTDALARMQHAGYMKRYRHVWIPDAAGDENLAGKLAHGKHIPEHATYIGALCRFTKPLTDTNPTYEAALILSGPEPQRSLLEDDFLAQIGAFPHKKFLLIRGKKEPLETVPPHLTQIPLADHHDIQHAYAQAEHIICRSGYTSVMEMAAVGRSAWLIPTPGQTEQEYLARHLHGRHWFSFVRQDLFKLEDVWKEIPSKNRRAFVQPSNTLAQAIQAFLSEIK